MAKDTTGRLHVTVKTGGKRKLSSKLWLERQLNDPYVAQARRAGYRSRAAYKLIEIDDKYRVLKPGMTVVDLGAAPGSWSQVAAQKVGPGGKVLAVDLLQIAPISGVTVLQADFRDAKLFEALGTMLGPTRIGMAFLYTALVGAALALAIAWRRKRLATTIERAVALVSADGSAARDIEHSAAHNRFAYAPAIALGTLASALGL